MVACRARREGGAAAVEFGLVLLPLMTLLLGLIQYGWYFYSSQAASSAAREGARRVAVGDCWDRTTELIPFVKTQAPMVDDAEYSPSDLSPDSVTVGTPVTVTVTVDDADIIGFLPMPGGGSIEQSFEVRLEDKTAGATICSP